MSREVFFLLPPCLEVSFVIAAQPDNDRTIYVRLCENIIIIIIIIIRIIMIIIIIIIIRIIIIII